MIARRGRHWGWSFVVVLVLVVPARVACAVSPEAEALFREGRRLMAEGKTAEACAAFAKSYSVDASSGTLLNLAFCHETQGKTATAWSEYRETVQLAHAQGREDRAATARLKLDALQALLARLTLKIEAAVPGLTIATELEGIPQASWGQPTPIDPGIHQITASAPGYRSFTTVVKLSDVEQRLLAIPPLERVSPLPPPAAKPAPAPLLGRIAGAASEARPYRPIDIYLASAGGLLVVAGSVFYGLAYEKFDAAKSTCSQGAGCTTTQRDALVSTIETWRDLGIASWVAGGALVVASGLHHWLSARPSPLTVAIDPWHNTLSIRALF